MAALPIFDSEGRYILRETVEMWAATPFGVPPAVPTGQVLCRIWPDMWAFRNAIVASSLIQWSHVMITASTALLSDGRDGVYGPLTLQPASTWVQRIPPAGPVFYRVVWVQEIYRGDGLRNQVRTLMVRLLGNRDSDVV